MTITVLTDYHWPIKARCRSSLPSTVNGTTPTRIPPIHHVGSLRAPKSQSTKMLAQFISGYHEMEAYKWVSMCNPIIYVC
jgi:hypothetical protein